jgi:hypothetical protein
MIDLIGRLKDGSTEVEVVEHHLHPQLSVTTPNGRLRVGALTFGAAAADTETITLSRAGGDSRVYTFKAALGAAPAAGNVTILVQGTADLTARRFADAVNGVANAVNILYSAGESYHPNFTGGYTGQRVAIGTVPHPTAGVGPTVVVVGRNGDQTGVATLSDTIAHGGIYKLTAITRIYSSRYILTGNAAALIDRVAGGYQCVCPMNSVRNPFESGSPVCKYDCGKIVVEATVSDALITEVDGYYSADEITFVPLWYGLEASRDQATKGCQQFMVNSRRIPAGSGFYIKARSNGTDPTDWIDFKAQYHIYPSSL